MVVSEIIEGVFNLIAIVLIFACMLIFFLVVVEHSERDELSLVEVRQITTEIQSSIISSSSLEKINSTVTNVSIMVNGSIAPE